MAEEQQPNNPEGEPERRHVSARVPDSIGSGVFASSTVVMAAAHELVLDFLQTLVQPHQLVARVIVPWPTVPQLVVALRQNLAKYDSRFGRKHSVGEEHIHVDNPAREDSTAEPVEQREQQSIGQKDLGAAVPAQQAGGTSDPPSPSEDKPQIVTRQVRAQSFYDELRLDDELLRGHYSNGAMINHTQFEFKIDFLMTLVPHPIVTARVFLSEPQVRRLLAAIEENEGRRRRS